MESWAYAQLFFLIQNWRLLFWAQVRIIAHYTALSQIRSSNLLSFTGNLTYVKVLNTYKWRKPVSLVQHP